MHPQVVNLKRQYLQVDKDAAALKLLMITLEFKRGTFSGNGVYAQSIARSLARRGNEVLVISGNPVKHVHSASLTSNVGQQHIHAENLGENQNKYGQTSSSHTNGVTEEQVLNDLDIGLYELEVDVEEDGWGRLDWKCPWRSFAQGIKQHEMYVAKFRPSWVLVVDWSSLPAFESLSMAMGMKWRMAFLNFRIYTVSEYQGEDGRAEKRFYKDMESKAVSMASAVSALSSRDANILATQLGEGIRDGVVPKPHFPPLREDLRAVALARNSINQEFGSTEKWQKSRLYLTCCVRLSPEKNTELFASLIEVLAVFLSQQQIVPFLCGGAKRGNPYADRIRMRVREAMPEAIIYEGFMGASDLADLYSQTLLNLHPCIYDAYGMTIVEAAAFASPSIVHAGSGGAVGAAEFLDPSQGQVIPLDLMADPQKIADEIKELLLNRSYLAKVGCASQERSLSWDEDANADQLMGILESAPLFTKDNDVVNGVI
ncbi:hypothetical protein KP509_07G098500 [Ceratopteris richardii]|nr:hypothetical protein KP509_07G098500 [Ceratopteris richardii]